MKNVIDTIKSHVSCRYFDSTYTLTDKELNAILESAKRAPSSVNQQMFSLVLLDDKDKKQELAELVEKVYPRSNLQKNIFKDSSIILIYLIDFYKVALLLDDNLNFENLEEALNPILVSTTDATISLENASLTAQSLGLGTVILGVIKYMSDRLIDMLKLPKYTLPYLGLAIGKPTKINQIKPRLPNNFNIFYNEYDKNAVTIEKMYDYSEELKKNRDYTYAKMWAETLKDDYKNKSFPSKTIALLKKQKIIK